jgi:hypothetical protein
VKPFSSHFSLKTSYTFHSGCLLPDLAVAEEGMQMDSINNIMKALVGLMVAAAIIIWGWGYSKEKPRPRAT